MANEDLRDIICEAILAEMRNGPSGVEETGNVAEETKASGQKTAAHNIEIPKHRMSGNDIPESKDLVVRMV